MRYDSNVAGLFIPAATVHALNTFDQIADDPDNVHVDSALKQKLFTYLFSFYHRHASTMIHS